MRKPFPAKRKDGRPWVGRERGLGLSIPSPSVFPFRAGTKEERLEEWVPKNRLGSIGTDSPPDPIGWNNERVCGSPARLAPNQNVEGSNPSETPSEEGRLAIGLSVSNWLESPLRSEGQAEVICRIGSTDANIEEPGLVEGSLRMVLDSVAPQSCHAALDASERLTS